MALWEQSEIDVTVSIVLACLESPYYLQRQCWQLSTLSVPGDLEGSESLPDLAGTLKTQARSSAGVKLAELHSVSPLYKKVTTKAAWAGAGGKRGSLP